MSLPELKTPIRIYWDLDSDSYGLDYAGIAGQIAGLRILSLDITETAPVVSTAWEVILERLKPEIIAVSLTLPLDGVTADILNRLKQFRLKTLFVQVAGVDAFPPVRTLRQEIVAIPFSLGVSCDISRDNYRQLPELLRCCVEEGVSLALPMQRLEPGKEPFYLSGNERRELAERLSRVERPEKHRVTIHDPFLWRAFHPAVAFPEGRCQAANTMLHIAANVDVYPCASLPVKLGNLQWDELAVVAASALKKGVRERLLATPERCGGCGELMTCLGGCRGRGYYATGSWEEPDPGCGEYP